MRLSTLLRRPLAGDVACMAAIAIAFILLAGWRLAEPARPFFDETLHAFVAAELLMGVSPSDFAHPMLSRELIAGGMALFGGGFDPAAQAWSAHHAFAWRTASVAFGAIGLVTLFALGRALGLARGAALAATGLLALDGVYFLHSRMAMTNVFEVAFVLLGSLGAWLAVSRSKPGWLWLTGLALGGAVATRWTGLFAWGLLLGWVAWQGRALGARWWGTVAVAFFVVPPLVYAASFAPLVLQGPGPWTSKLFSLKAWGEIWALNVGMWRFHHDAISPHPFSSPWWSWPLMGQPVWYDFAYQKATGTIQGLWAIGNALLWWASLPALAAAAWCGTRGSRALGFAAWMGLGLWLPWASQSRGTYFMTYLLESLPFVALILAFGAAALWRRGGGGRALVLAYGVAAVAWFGWFYPLTTGAPISVEAYASRMVLGPQWEYGATVNRFRAAYGLDDPRKLEAFQRQFGNLRYRP